MKITPKAKELFLSLLKENKFDFVHVYVVDEKEESLIKIELLTKDETNGERETIISDIPFLLSEEDEYALTDVTFDEEDGDISLLIPEHHHEDGCCHHHHHEEGEDCCCHGDHCCCEEE